MPPHLLHPDEYELVNRDSSESSDTFNLDEADFESQGLTSTSYVHSSRHRFLRPLLFLSPLRLKAAFNRSRLRQCSKRSNSRRTSFLRLSARRIHFICNVVLSIICILVILTAIFRPSYTRLPTHYKLLKNRILSSSDSGRGNPDNQKIFIATSIYDKHGHLASGAWGEAVLSLVHILGNKNVFLSIYENDGGIEAQNALDGLESRVHCSHRLLYEEHLALDNISHIVLPDGTERVKRISYLAAVRNKALFPLEEPSIPRYDKILFLNDVIFNPVDAAQLLFSTHVDDYGKANYAAACAVDFINPFKFYDTFATRDLEGYSMGVPFFPWFSNSGEGLSRQDVLDGKDAVRVKSCWGGMVAFDAKFFQPSRSNKEATNVNFTVEARGLATNVSSRPPRPIRFRAESELFWDASECCLIHADVQSISTDSDAYGDFGIYQNPFVRVAYDSRSLWWLGYTRRIERLYSWPHLWVNRLVGLPWFNPRRSEQEGVEVKQKVWISDSSMRTGGSFQEITRVATNGGFCGSRTLQLLKETSREGEKNWEKIPIPPG